MSDAGRPQPSNAPTDAEVQTVDLDAGGDDVGVDPVGVEGDDTVGGVFAQQNVGSDNMAGGGEWADPNTPARGPAPGTGDEAPTQARGFAAVLNQDSVAGGSSSTPDQAAGGAPPDTAAGAPDPDAYTRGLPADQAAGQGKSTTH